MNTTKYEPPQYVIFSYLEAEHCGPDHKISLVVDELLWFGPWFPFGWGHPRPWCSLPVTGSAACGKYCQETCDRDTQHSYAGLEQRLSELSALGSAVEGSESRVCTQRKWQIIPINKYGHQARDVDVSLFRLGDSN
jgi:hypothetical protein